MDTALLARAGNRPTRKWDVSAEKIVKLTQMAHTQDLQRVGVLTKRAIFGALKYTFEQRENPRSESYNRIGGVGVRGDLHQVGCS